MIPALQRLWHPTGSSRGIPPETYEYRLGNRSALEWVIDQYQVSTEKRSGITNDPAPTIRNTSSGLSAK